MKYLNAASTNYTVMDKAVNHLLKNDIEVVQAAKDFTADGKTYPKGTYIVKMDQVI